MLENKQTYINSTAHQKVNQGVRAVASNKNMPETLKNVIITQALLKPSPISGNQPRG